MAAGAGFAAVFVEVFEVLDVFDVAAGAGIGAGAGAGLAAGAGVDVLLLVFDAAGVEAGAEAGVVPPDAAGESAVVDFFDRDFFVVVPPSAVVELPDAVELAGAAAVPPAVVPPVVVAAGVSVVDFLLLDFFVVLVVPEASVDPVAVVDAFGSAAASDAFLRFFLLVLVSEVAESVDVVDESSVAVVDFFFFFGFGVLSSGVCVVLEPVVDGVCVAWCATARKSVPAVNKKNAAATTNKRCFRINFSIWSPFLPLETGLTWTFTGGYARYGMRFGRKGKM